MIKVEKFKIPIYSTRVTIVQGKDLQKIGRALRLKYPKDWTFENTTAITSFRGKKGVFMVFKKGVSAGVIAHECLHAAGGILSDKGYRYEPDNDEPMAYLLGYMVDKVVKILSK